MPKSFLEDIGGLYNPTLRFAFTNITAEDFTSRWDGVPITIKAGETIEVSNTTPIPGAGHALALKMTGELVDKIMIGDAKMDEVAKNQPYYRSPKASALGVPAARKPLEDQILRQLDPEEESPAIQTIRKQMMAEIAGQPNPNKPAPPPATLNPKEFADLTDYKSKVPVAPVLAKPARTKPLGRPPGSKNKVVATDETPHSTAN